ncbi:MAG: hypothetical protein ACFFBH_03635 [Promethearchaeota archaeon]
MLKQIEEFSDVLKKKFDQEKQNNKKKVSALKNCRLDIVEIKSAIEFLPNGYKELNEK